MMESDSEYRFAMIFYILSRECLCVASSERRECFRSCHNKLSDRESLVARKIITAHAINMLTSSPAN
jgi:hypothetical protein